VVTHSILSGPHVTSLGGDQPERNSSCQESPGKYETIHLYASRVFSISYFLIRHQSSRIDSKLVHIIASFSRRFVQLLFATVPDKRENEYQRYRIFNIDTCRGSPPSPDTCFSVPRRSGPCAQTIQP
jgi:hypothetical protein